MKNKKPLTLHARHINALFTFIALLPLVYYIPPWLEDHVTDNHLMVTVIALVIIVPLVSYIVLPVILRLLATHKQEGY